MSNAETQPREHVCVNGPRADEPGADRPIKDLAQRCDAPTSSPAPEEGQLSPGVVYTAEGVHLLEPRNVPLGGPRAMNVQRVLPQRARSLVGAWCFLDFYGPEDLHEATPMRVPQHPHTGLATCSWLFSGRIDHLDSAGHTATVEPGDVVLMNAGRGITHSEFSTADTAVLHGAQLWYAFPQEYRFVAPSLESHRPEPVTGAGWQAKVFLGKLLGYESPVHSYVPLTGAEVRLEPGHSLEIDVPAEHEHALLRVSGDLSLNGRRVPQDHLAVVDTGADRLVLEAGDEPVLALLIGGEPLGEQIVMWWNFVGRSHEEIAAFRAAYQAQMGFETHDDGGLSALNPIPDTASAAASTVGIRLAAGDHFAGFPPNQPAPLPAPELPTVQMKPRG